MRKIFIKLFIISILVVSLSTYLFGEILKSSHEGETKLEQLDQEINEEIEKYGGVEDVAGYAFMIKAIGASIYDIGNFFFYFILICIPIFILRGILVLQFIVILFQIGHEKKWKNTVGQILTGISVIIQMIVCIMFLILFCIDLQISKILVFITLFVNIVSLVIYLIQLIKTTRYKFNNKLI